MGAREPDRLPTLKSERLVLRQVEPGDIPALDAIVAEPEVAKWWPLPVGESMAFDAFSPGTHAYAIEADDEVAGTIMFAEEEHPLYRHAGIDIMLSTAFQGRGLGTEALRALVGYLLGARGHHRVTIDPALANERAIHTYEKVGFRRIGVARAYEATSDGVFHDNLLMDLLASDFAETCGDRSNED